MINDNPLSHGFNNLFNDKISATIYIPKKYRKYIIRNLHKLLEKGILKLSIPKKNKKGQRYRFYATDKIKGKDLSGVLHISIDPLKYNPENSPYFIRVEFNPDRYTQKGLIHIRSILRKLSGRKNVFSYFSNPRITRLDFAFDSEEFLLNETYVYIKSYSKSKPKKDDKTGMIETLYVGSKLSDKSYCIYDKKREIEKNLGIYIKNVRNINITRVEARLKNQQITISELQDILNPYKDIRLYSNFFNRARFGKKFLKILDEEGLQKALMSVKEKTRIKYLKYLQPYELDLFDAEKIWSEFNTSIKFIKTIFKEEED